MKKLFALVATLKASVNASARSCTQCRRRLTRGLFVLGASVLILIQAAGIAAAAAPINDNRDSATRIPVLPYNDSGSNRLATTEAGEPRPCGGIGKTIWYVFQFASEVNVTAHTSRGPGMGGIDTVLAAYEDTGSGLINVACDDDFYYDSNQSKINWIATANKTYFIQLGSACGGCNDAGTTASFSFEVVAETVPHVLSINDVTVTEGNAGTTTDAVFTVTKSGSADVITTVDFATANGYACSRDGACEPSDYTQVSGTLTFPGGDFTKTITVVVNGDTAYENWAGYGYEYFWVDLMRATNATVSKSEGQGLIMNDDAAPAGISSPSPATNTQQSPNPHSSSSPGATGVGKTGGDFPSATGSGQTEENLPGATGAKKTRKNLPSATGVNRTGKDLPDAPGAEASESPSPLIRAQGKSGGGDKAAAIAFIAVMAVASAGIGLWKLRRT